MIELENVTRIYAAAPGRGRTDTVALDDVSLAIPPGGVWGVVGPNGAGKTTLFGLVLGFIHPTHGRVRIDGLEPRRYLRRHGAAYLPERFRLPPEWTVGDALRALAGLEGLKGVAARERVAGAAPARLRSVGTGIVVVNCSHVIRTSLCGNSLLRWRNYTPLQVLPRPHGRRQAVQARTPRETARAGETGIAVASGKSFRRFRGNLECPTLYWGCV